MTTEQAAPQSEDQVFPRMLSHVVNEIANLRLKLIQPHLTVSLREHYEAKVMELEQLIRILEAWPEIENLLRLCKCEENWDGDTWRLTEGWGIHPRHSAQRALALVKGDGK